jgi:hypothetical protein
MLPTWANTSPFRRRDPQQSSAFFRIAAKDEFDGARFGVEGLGVMILGLRIGDEGLDLLFRV